MPDSITQLATPAPAPDRFEEQVAAVLMRLRRAVAAVLSAVPGLESPCSATDVQRALKINSKLSWQIHKFATTRSPLDVASHVPKPVAMKRFCDAARRKGTPLRAIDELAGIFTEFERHIDRHAGDRTIFDSMVGSLGGDAAAAQIDLQHRRDAFRAQTHIFGMHARSLLSLMIFRPGAQPGTVDGVTVGGQINLRRFRHDARWILFGRSVASDKEMIGSRGAQPLNPEDYDRFGAPMLSRFCTMPAGSFRMIETPHQVRYIEAISDDIGNNSASTYLSGEVWRNVAYTVNDDGSRVLIARGSTRTPAQSLYHDVMIHRDLPVITPPEVTLYNDLRTGDDTLLHDDSARLPLFEGVTSLGRGIHGIAAPEFPHYTDLAQYALNEVGWDPEEFETFRFHLDYPVLPSTAVHRFRVKS